MLILALQVAATTLVLLFVTIFGLKVTAPTYTWEDMSPLYTTLVIVTIVEIVVIVGAVLVAIWNLPELAAICS